MYKLAVAQYYESVCVHCRIASVVSNRHSWISQPVRKTVLHKSSFYVSFHLLLFCLYCVKGISHERSFFLPLAVCRWALAQCPVVGCRPASAHRLARKTARLQRAGGRKSGWSWPPRSGLATRYHLHGVKGRTPVKSRDRSVDSFKKNFLITKHHSFGFGLDTYWARQLFVCALVLTLRTR